MLSSGVLSPRARNGKEFGTPIKSLRDTWCTRVVRREFSFHGQRDNPSLCHFSSVFLSPRLIELLVPRAPEIPGRHVPPFFFFFPSSSSSSSRRERKRPFPRIRYLGRTKLDFVIPPPVRSDARVPVASLCLLRRLVQRPQG